MVNVNATNIVKNKSQRDKLVNLLHLLCHVTYIFLLNFKIKSLNTPRYHLSLYQTYHQFLAGKQGVEPRSTVLETGMLAITPFPYLVSGGFYDNYSSSLLLLFSFFALETTCRERMSTQHIL